MPNRLRVVGSLTQDVIGTQRFNGAIGKCVSIPDDDYEAVKDAMTAVLERVIRAVDWPRLLREASFRHDTVHPDHKPDDRDWSPATGVCGECLAEALLADDRGAQDWERTPTIPREHAITDWPALVARHFHHREAALWHPYKEPLPDDGRRP
ncbi:hypothetical protein GCM10010306_103610 [Streptomyces umbrinus]|uniref:hypothetical protein n=1 Tax=Streptomyces umbrinus TaxID=67370 RepID=UPI001675334C|nr:hypothetical protein [Streptomyces umbrinus]GHB91667.1 hypothetical protein GCM10010306_103610 [Streptomyces umbrinus]